MSKQFTASMIRELRTELNEAVRSIAEKHGLTIQFGNAKYDNLTATYQVNANFAATEGFDPAKEIWDTHCQFAGLEKDDFGKTFSFLGEVELYKITGYNPKARTNNILIQRVHDKKEFVCSAQQVRMGLGRVQTQQIPPLNPSVLQPENQVDKSAKTTWDMYCRMYGLAPEDFGKTVFLSGSFYKICGIKPNARTNSILIRNTVTNKEYVTRPDAIQSALKGE